jgi:hypothetical protein
MKRTAVFWRQPFNALAPILINLLYNGNMPQVGNPKFEIRKKLLIQKHGR